MTFLYSIVSRNPLSQFLLSGELFTHNNWYLDVDMLCVVLFFFHYIIKLLNPLHMGSCVCGCTYLSQQACIVNIKRISARLKLAQSYGYFGARRPILTLSLKRIATCLKLHFFWRRANTNECGALQKSRDISLIYFFGNLPLTTQGLDKKCMGIHLGVSLNGLGYL